VVDYSKHNKLIYAHYVDSDSQLTTTNG